MSLRISHIIERDFNGNVFKEVQKMIEEVYKVSWNVDHDQLIRSLLYLSNGSIDKFNSFFPIIDPRDIIMAAQMKEENKENYF